MSTEALPTVASPSEVEETSNIPTLDPLLTRKTDVAWYVEDIKTLPEGVMRLFTEYSGIPKDKVIPHILEFRSKAWHIYPYPCIGSFRFLALSLSSSPHYSKILERLKSPQPAKLLDLGCCFGFDLRQAMFDGAPPHTLIGSDIRGEFLELGYDMFLDREKLKDSGIKFIAADIFDDSSELTKLEGSIDVVYVGSFLHLFEWNGQVDAARRIAKMMKPGSILVGRQAGNLNAGTHFQRFGGCNTYYHNQESIKKLWEEVEGEWKIESSFVDLEKPVAADEEDFKLIQFLVEKL